jgi:hypothetical protein
MNIVVLRLYIQCGRPAREREKRGKIEENIAIEEHEFLSFFFFVHSLIFCFIDVHSCFLIDRHRHPNETAADFMKTIIPHYKS